MINLQVDLRLVGGATALGGDNHNTSRGTVTIQGCRSSILQHRHALDIIRVQVCNVTIVDDTIDNIKRLVATVERTNTTNADVRLGTWLTIGVVHLHTRSSTFKGTCYSRSDALLNLFRVDRGNGTSDRLALSCTISHDNHLVNELGIALQEYAHTILYRKNLTLEAQIRDLNLIFTCGDGNAEATVHVSQHTSTGTNHLNSSTNDGLTVLL